MPVTVQYLSTWLQMPKINGLSFKFNMLNDKFNQVGLKSRYWYQWNTALCQREIMYSRFMIDNLLAIKFATTAKFLIVKHLVFNLLSFLLEDQQGTTQFTSGTKMLSHRGFLKIRMDQRRLSSFKGLSFSR